MKRGDDKAIVPVQRSIVSLVETQIQIIDKVLLRHKREVDVFSVPSDGTLYEAVNRVRPGGTIHISAGEFNLDTVLHIRKPLSIVGIGRNATRITSPLAQHFIIIEHEGFLSIKSLTLNSQELLQEGMLSASCKSIQIEQCGFQGIDGFENRPDDNNPLTGAFMTRNKTVGLIKDCQFIGNYRDVTLHEDSNIEISDSRFESQGGDCNIQFYNNSHGKVLSNHFIGKSASIIVQDNAAAFLECNTCNGAAFGIVYQGNSTGIAKENVCIDEFIHGIEVQGAASAILIRNTCEGNIEGIAFYDESSGRAKGNICRKSHSYGIVVSQTAIPILIHNTCEENRGGIIFSENSGGTAKANLC